MFSVDIEQVVGLSGAVALTGHVISKSVFSSSSSFALLFVFTSDKKKTMFSEIIYARNRSIQLPQKMRDVQRSFLL